MTVLVQLSIIAVNDLHVSCNEGLLGLKSMSYKFKFDLQPGTTWPEPGWVACLQIPLNLFLTSTTNSDCGIVCNEEYKDYLKA